MNLKSKYILKYPIKTINTISILAPGYILNDVAVDILKLCNGKNTVLKIISSTQKKYVGSKRKITLEVKKFISKLIFLSILKEI